MQTVHNRTTAAIALGSVLVLAAPIATAAPFFMGLGDSSGGNSYSIATSISADGSVVVGSSDIVFSNRAFRWTQADGMIDLDPLLFDRYIDGYAFDASADGSVIVGSALWADYSYGAFRWTQTDGMVNLGTLPGGFESRATGVSADGSVTVGYAVFSDGYTYEFEGFRWTQADGMVGLGDLYFDSFYSPAVSADGSVVVGTSSRSAVNGAQAFRWTQADGMVDLGYLSDGVFFSNAYAVSADGSVIVGSSDALSGHEAFRWTQTDGMVGLGDLPGGIFSSRAYAVSADGSVVVGDSATDKGYSEAFLWDSISGMRNLRDVLIDGFGLDLASWTLTIATGISADGKVIVGNGLNPQGQEEAWIANLRRDPVPPTVPEPTTLALLGFGLAGIGWAKKRRSKA